MTRPLIPAPRIPDTRDGLLTLMGDLLHEAADHDSAAKALHGEAAADESYAAALARARAYNIASELGIADGVDRRAVGA